jgi:hypothetical protein
MDLVPTISFTWIKAVSVPLELKAQDSGWNSSNVYTDPISTSNADQIGLFVFGTNYSAGTAMDVLVRIRWGFELATDIDMPSSLWADESVETYDGLISSGGAPVPGIQVGSSNTITFFICGRGTKR